MRVLSRLLDRLEETIIACLMAGATGLIFVAVIYRYGIGLSADLSTWGKVHHVALVGVPAEAVFEWLSARDLSWAQELCIYMFIWMAKFGAAYGVRTGIHVGVDVLVNMVAPEERRKVVLLSLLAGALFTGIISVLGGVFVGDMYATGQQSNDLEAPMWIVYLAIPLGSGLMCFRFLQVAWHYVRTGVLPHHDAGHVEGMMEADS